MNIVKIIQYKIIQVGNQDIQIPDYLQFIAIDKDGLITAFLNKPVPLEDKGYWDDPTASEFIEIGLAILGDTDWKTTLIQL